MKKWTIVIATALLFLTRVSPVVAGSEAANEADADCAKVFKAKASAEKGISSEQLSADLGLPVAKVNACLLSLRRVEPMGTPQTGH